jgi:AcrR family transcriptional regulator
MTVVNFTHDTHLESATPTLNRAQRSKADKHRKVVAAARLLFMRDGFAATTISDIAEKADVAKGTVFTHAPNKERLLVLVFDELMRTWLDDAYRSALRGKHLIDKLDRFFSHLMSAMGEHAELSAIFMRELPYSREEIELETIEGSIDQILADLIDTAKSLNEIDPHVPTFTLSRNLFYTYYTAQYLWLAAGAPPKDSLVPTLREQIAVQIDPLKTDRSRK